MGKRKDMDIRKNENRKEKEFGGNNNDLKLQLLISFIIGIAIGVVLVFFLISIYGEFNGEAILTLYSGLGICLISIFLHIPIHEAGHLVFGLMTGYSLLSFRIFSITFVKEQGRIRVKRFNIPGTAGQCLMIPPSVPTHKLPYRLYNYGGVIMNLTVSALAILPLLLFPEIPILFDFMIGGFAAAGILLAAVNGIPTKVFGVSNDGNNARAIKRDPYAKSSLRLQLELIAKQSKGLRLKDMPDEEFELPEDVDLSNVLHAYIQYMKFNRELDRMDFAAARESLEKLIPVLPKLPSSFRNSTAMGLLFLSVLSEASEEEVEQYLTKQVKLLIKSAKKELNTRRIAYAYYKLYLKDEKAAAECRRRINILAEKYPIVAEAEMNLMLAEHIEKVAEEVSLGTVGNQE